MSGRVPLTRVGSNNRLPLGVVRSVGCARAVNSEGRSAVSGVASLWRKGLRLECGGSQPDSSHGELSACGSLAERAKFCVECGLADGARADPRGAKGRQRPVLRPRRVHPSLGRPIPRTSAPPPRITPACARNIQAVRGHGREVHRRCRHGGLRGAADARGRRRARCASRPSVCSRRSTS